MIGSLLWMFCVLGASGVVLVALALYWMARMLVSPPRMTERKASYVLNRRGPGDVGIAEFEPITFHVPSGDGSREKAGELKIASWWMPHPDGTSTRSCVLVHGFADAKVGALAWAPTWRALGFNLLVIDLRAHGESEGRYCSGGFFERSDLSVILDSIQSAKPQAAKRVVLFGVSLGGATCAACAARRDDIDAIVLDSVFAHYRQAAQTHAGVIAAPLPRLQSVAIRWGERRCGADFDEVAPVKTLLEVKCPVMLIHGTMDPFVTPEAVNALSTALLSRGNPLDEHWLVPDAWHALSLQARPEEYAQRVDAFVNKAFET